MQHDVTLTLLDTGDVLQNVYDRYDVTLDMLRPGSPWTFSLWRTNGGADGAGEGARALDPGARTTAWETLLKAARLGGQVLFAIDGAPVLNGRITDLNTPGTRAAGEAVVIAGTDLAGLALGGEADPRLCLRGRPLEECLAQLFNRVGIEVVVLLTGAAERAVRTRARRGGRGATASDAPHRRSRVDLMHARPGETVWQVADSIVRKLGLMMWVAPYAAAASGLAVVVDVPAYETAALFRFERRERDGVLTPESNVLEREFPRSLRGVPTIVYAAGGGEFGADAAPSRHLVPYPNDQLAASSQSGVDLVAPLPPQPRYLHAADALDPATAKQAAARAANDATREWRCYDPRVQGHGQLVGGRMRLYAPNVMATAFDRTGRRTLLNDEAMLITRVQFAGSRAAGQTTRLRLGTKGAIRLSPTPG